MVLGAGRGPLVNASLRAARQADRKLRVYAVEKNPNAVITWVQEVFKSRGRLSEGGGGVFSSDALMRV